MKRLADGLSEEASQRIDEGKPAEPVPVYRRALAVLDIPNPILEDRELTKAVNEQRAALEGMLKDLEKVVKKPPLPAPPRAKK